ncbi:MAG: hypothetical protein U9O78_01605 [Patescibacteria group bacterium]|nr:hypothetical protein [Patescibacteria group bacterium]
MREHPIPQDITGYRFHLVGSMTLKQFAELVVGSLIALFIYKTSLPGFIKWPLVFTSVGLGFAVAFVPFEERPLDHWLLTFLKALYKPTKFFWQRENVIPDAFNYKASKEPTTAEFQADLSPARKKRIQEFIQSIDQPGVNTDDFEKAAHQKIDSILASFDTVKVPNQLKESAVPQKKQKPNLKVRVRKLKSFNESQSAFDQQTLKSTTSTPHKKPTISTLQPSSNKNTSKPKIVNQQANQAHQVKQQTNQISIKTPSKTLSSANKIKKTLKTSLLSNSSSKKQGSKNQSSQEEKTYNHTAQHITKNKSLPFPSPPTKPNKLVGMVINHQKEMVGGVVVEIKNEQGQVVRAVKTNSLGQFFISTPLKDGTYFIDVEEEGLNFQTQKLVLKGKIIDPLEIRAETS